MRHHRAAMRPSTRLVSGVSAAALVTTGLFALAAPAATAATEDGTTVIITAPSGLMDFSETRTAGHNDFLEDGLHIYTDDASSQAKAAGYVAFSRSLTGFGEPSQVWTPSDDLPPFPDPGEQIVTDFDGDGTPDGILVGEPNYYGNNWWLSNSAAQFVKDGAPHMGGGFGSPYYGTLVEWAAAFPNAMSAAVGYSLGSGIHGDGVLSSMTYNDTTFTFALGIGACEALIDDPSMTYTLTQDCTTKETIHVPDGWTLNGDNYTITAVEDVDSPNFPGPIVMSASGTDATATSMHVTDLNIDTQFSGTNSGGLLAGIRFDRAGGSVSNVTIDGVTHGNGVQEGIGLYVRNRDSGGGSSVSEATVSIDNVTVTHFQKGGIVLDGNTAFTMTNTTIGRSTDGAGNPLSVLAANSLQISRGAHGSVADSSVGLNDYNPNPPPGDGSDATGILLYNAGTVTIDRTIVSGTNGDVGLDAYNVSSGEFVTDLTMSCMLFQRDEVDGDYDPYGVGVAQWDDGSDPVTISLSDSTFSGWNYDTGVLSGIPPALNVEPGVANQETGACAPTAPADLTGIAGDGSADVTWTAATAPAYAPLQGYEIEVTGSDSSTQSVTAGAGDTSAHITGLAQGVTYTVSVTAVNASGASAPATVTLSGTSVTLVPDAVQLKFKKKITLRGTLSSSDGGANVAGQTVQLEELVDGVWTFVDDAVTDGTGAFKFVNVAKAKKNTNYRAYVPATGTMMASTSAAAPIYVMPKIKITVSDSTVGVGDTVLFTGRVNPKLKGHPVTLEMNDGSGWQAIATTNLKAHSRYEFFWDAAATGTFKFRVTIGATDDLVGGKSKQKKVVVS